MKQNLKHSANLFAAAVAVTSVALASVCAVAQDQPQEGAAPVQTSSNERLVEARAARMVKSAIALFSSNEEDRAVGMLEAVSRLYPDSQMRFSAALELGRHFLEKRVFDRALSELTRAGGATDHEVRAESLLLLGRMYAAKGSASEAAMALRRLVQDHPSSPFANDAYFMLGQLHFESGRWSRAAEAFEMVGTAVPESSSKSNETVLVEAGQRVFVHVRDKDLTILDSLGEKSYVELSSKSGDAEKAELVRFGRAEGEFLASVQISPSDTPKGDGVLTVHGSEPVQAVYVDANTESGDVNRKVLAESSVVSSASIAFLDGAQRESIHGVFVGQPTFVQLRDFDLDVSGTPDTAKIIVKTLYRERPECAPGETQPPPPAPDAPWLTRTETEMTVTETGPRTGVFSCRVVPVLMPDGTNAPPAAAAGEVYVRPDEKIAVEYMDARHIEGFKPVARGAEAFVLVGGSTEPQSTVSHSSVAAVQAKKLLIEARLLCKWGLIFKDVGLQENANAKADEGLMRVSEIFDLASRNSLDRSIVEEAYEARWSLLIVKDAFRQAIETCNALVKRYPDTVLADRAFLQIANARIQEDTKESRASALGVLSAIITLPSSPLKAEAQFRIGEVREAEARAQAAENGGRKADFSAAIAAYRLCAETYPSSSFAGESFKRIVDYDISIKNYAAAQETLERVFQDYPDAPWLDEMMLKWGVVRHRMGDTEGAKEKFHQLLDEYPGGKAAKTASDFLAKLGDE